MSRNWSRTDQRGCGPDGSISCARMDLPVENRVDEQNRLQVRHIFPKAEVLAMVSTKTKRNVDTWQEDGRWYATLMNGSRADNRRRAVPGKTEREALQNLGERYGLNWRPCPASPHWIEMSSDQPVPS